MAKPKQPTDRMPQASPVQAAAVQAAAVQAAPTKAASMRVAPAKAASLAAQPSQEPPGSVRLAARLMYAGAVLSAADLIVTLATAGKARSLLLSAHPSWSQSRLSATVHAEIAYYVVTWLVTIALWIVMARTNLAGRGWARVVSTVLCVLSSLSFAFYISEPSSLVSKLVLVPLWLAGAGAIVLLWRPATTAYIRSGQA